MPTPMSDPAAVDPEEAFVASLSSCHMLWFLSIAARRGFVVDDYRDSAEGALEAEDGRQRMTRVTLRPHVTYHGDAPALETEDAMHHAAHESCFIAASVTSEIVIEPVRS
ncbi:MAG: OsmC family protein [Rubrivirga sp.]